MPAPALTVIIPAFNAAETIEIALNSLRRQTRGDWEALVIDDGSTDGSAALVEAFAREDARFRLIRAEHGGVSAARNRGISEAAADWILFLDADDWVAPKFVESMLEAAEKNPQPGVHYCDWLRVTPSGSFPVEQLNVGEDFFLALSDHCVFAIHCCIVRTSLVRELGGFDPSLRTSEDWDLWLRVARTGARFGHVPEPLSYYQTRPGSASMDGLQLFKDGLEVIGRGHRPDARVAKADRRYVSGAPVAELPAKQIHFLCYVAGMVIGSKGDTTPLFDCLPPVPCEPNAILSAYILVDAIGFGACKSRAELPDLWPSIMEAVTHFLRELEARQASPHFTRKTLFVIEKLVAESRNSPEAAVIGMTYTKDVEVTEPIKKLTVPTGVERAYLKVLLEGEELGNVYLPVIGGRIKAEVLRDVIALQFGSHILERFFKRNLYHQLKFTETEFGMKVSRDDFVFGVISTKLEESWWDEFYKTHGWTLFLQELWDKPDWNSTQFYSSEGDGESGHKVTMGSDPMIVEIGNDLPVLIASTRQVTAGVSIAGVNLGLISVPTSNRKITPDRLRSAITLQCGIELLTAAVREAIVGKTLTGSLRERLQQAAARSRSNMHAGTILVRRSPWEFGGTVSRYCDLPIDASSEFDKLQDTEFIVRTPGTATSLLYAPDALPETTFKTTNPADAKGPGILQRTFSRFQQPAATTNEVPILMYHRVAPEGHAALERYRVTPQLFASQLKFLKSLDYSTITMEAWRRAKERQEPIPQKSIILTFDDGYQDFAEHAWPHLQHFGMRATVFLVSDYIGKTNLWDVKYGENVPLMDWPEILRLQKEGVEFGSHSATHPYLTGLTNKEIVQEAIRSRVILQEKLGLITTFAYPYGDEDEVVRMLLGGCGYRCAVTCQNGRSSFNDASMGLKRIEVCGNESMEMFLRKLHVE